METWIVGAAIVTLGVLLLIASIGAARGRRLARLVRSARGAAPGSNPLRGETGGTGPGLSIARHIIDQHEGTIGVESIEGMGSTFRFSMPIAEPA